VPVSWGSSGRLCSSTDGYGWLLVDDGRVALFRVVLGVVIATGAVVMGGTTLVVARRDKVSRHRVYAPHAIICLGLLLLGLTGLFPRSDVSVREVGMGFEIAIMIVGIVLISSRRRRHAGSRTSSSAGTQDVETSTATVLISRRSGYWRDSIRSYVVLIDGRRSGAVSQGNTFAANLPPGEHTVRMRIDFLKSKPLTRDLQEGVTWDLECYPNSLFGISLSEAADQ
jgi:hypothetical protein